MKEAMAGDKTAELVTWVTTKARRLPHHLPGSSSSLPDLRWPSEVRPEPGPLPLEDQTLAHPHTYLEEGSGFTGAEESPELD